MLRFYYTTKAGANQPQTKISESLGGYISSTPVPGDSFGNLFDEISLNLTANPQTQYICLILKSEGTGAAEIRLWVEKLTQNNNGRILVGALEMKKDEDEQYYEVAGTSSIYEKPYWVEFDEYNSFGDSFRLGSLYKNDQLCVWFARELDADLLKSDYDNVAERDTSTQNRYKKIKKDTEEIFRVVMQHS